VINNLDGRAEVLHNEMTDGGNWLIVKLRGKAGNTDAIGAVVKVKAGKLSMLRFVRSGSSYIGQEDMRQHFGLGPASQADSVEVRWTDDTVTRMENVKANRVLLVEQR
jgi:enediyne biosynthesis protein E4